MHLSSRLHYHHYVHKKNGVQHNCEELLSEFEADVVKNGRIDLHPHWIIDLNPCGLNDNFSPRRLTCISSAGGDEA
jgi:hypothetical protein